MRSQHGVPQMLEVLSKRVHVFGAAFTLSVAGLAVFGVRDARACGGCFVPPEETESVITDEKMILSISMSQTTLYDQIEYSGAPASFAWVLPIKGTVKVGLSADVLFQTIEQLTATEVEQPPTNCPPPPSCGSLLSGKGEADAGAAATGSAGGGGVTVTAQAQVGPYETVQLHSTDGSALTNWLAAHGYQIPASTKPIIDAYVTDGFDFLALKLIPGAGVQAMQPVRVTSQGAAPSLPLHMVAVGTGATTGITIWVIADGRWAPKNFPTFTINDPDIAWDWVTSSSNYESLRLAKEATFNGRGWQIESSLELNQDSITQTLDYAVQYGTPGVGGYTAPPTAVTDAGATDARAGDAGAADAGAVDSGENADDAGELPAATADLAVLFNGIAGPNARFTRMRSDVAKSALSVDMALEASADQSELTNIHYPGKQVGEPECPVYNSSCEVTGMAPRSQAQADANSLTTGGGGGCSTTRPANESGAATGALLALAGIGLVRSRKKRKGSQKSG
jgi:hypothetical protein